jgi:hypothetical protein
MLDASLPQAAWAAGLELSVADGAICVVDGAIFGAAAPMTREAPPRRSR